VNAGRQLVRQDPVNRVRPPVHGSGAGARSRLGGGVHGYFVW
jgi:hypothetical protein